MTMTTMKTADLIGPALDWAVGLAVAGKPIACTGSVPRWKFTMLEASVWPGDIELGDIERYQPSSVWSDGGPLIASNGKRIGLELRMAENSASFLQSGMRIGYTASDALIAACRAIVAAKLGDVVQVPAELVEVRHAD